MRINEVIKLSAKPGSDPAKAWITKVYSQFPASPLDARQHYMVFDDNSVALFELVPSFDVDGAVEIKWLQANPPGTGAGGKAIKALQDIAKKDGMTLTLYPWDKGDMTQDQLIKYYSKFGFKQVDPDYPDMVWNLQNMGEAFTCGSNSKETQILHIFDKIKRRIDVPGYDIEYHWEKFPGAKRYEFLWIVMNKHTNEKHLVGQMPRSHTIRYITKLSD